MWCLQIFRNVKFIRGPMSKEFFGTSCRNSDWNAPSIRSMSNEFVITHKNCTFLLAVFFATFTHFESFTRSSGGGDSPAMSKRKKQTIHKITNGRRNCQTKLRLSWFSIIWFTFSHPIMYLPILTTKCRSYEFFILTLHFLFCHFRKRAWERFSISKFHL